MNSKSSIKSIGSALIFSACITCGTIAASAQSAADKHAYVSANCNSSQSAEMTKLNSLLHDHLLSNEEFGFLRGKILDDRYDYTNSTADQLMKLKLWLDQKTINAEEFAIKKNKVIFGD
jgi:hypothetical protein